MTLIVDKSSLKVDELLLMNEAVNDPMMYRVHTLEEHNGLICKHRKCILCLAGSIVVATSKEVEVECPKRK